jgi:hypothetical protein
MGRTSDGVPHRRCWATYGRRMEQSQLVPGPLGWCSGCLALDRETEAVTWMDGFAVCRDCNARGKSLAEATTSELLGEYMALVMRDLIGRGWAKIRSKSDTAADRSKIADGEDSRGV